MEGRSSPGERPSPVGKPAKRALPSPGSRKLPSPVKHVNGNKEELVGKQQNDDEYVETPCNGTDDSITMSPTSPSPTSPSKAGVAYISENLIKRLSKEENLANIKSLNLALGKDLNKKFRYLENLDNLKNLSALHISNHMIEKIEKLDKLTQLRELNLSRNSITKLEGLESLVHLQVLNISRNQIQTLPAPLMKKLRELRVFHFAYNSLESLLEITKLRPLQDLTEISMVGNPMSTLAHSHLYAIFQLRSLTTLDKQTVMDDERVAADDRFGQDEIRRLEAELNRQNKLYDALFEEKHSVSTELDKVSRLHQQQKEKDTQLAQRNKELQRELNAKEEILASKTKELSRACEKQFRLEQELAFYKLDAKFEHLGKLPWPEGAEFPEVEDDEAAYIGKAGYKPNAFARESHPLSPSQKAELSAIGARLSDRYGGQNKNTLDELHEALLSDLQDQEMAVKKAQLELAKLEDELRRKRNQLKDAVDELDQVQRAIEEEIQLLDDEDRRLMAAIAEKKKFIRDLEEVAADLEGRMNKIHADLRRKESEMNKLQHALNNTSPDDPAYVELQARLAETEQQLRDALSEYDSLKRDYDQAMAQLQEEIAALDKMQAELEKKRKTADKSAQQAELKSIINDLNKHLEAMKTQVAQQQEAIGQLQQEKEGLEQRLQESHDQAAQGNQQLQGTQDALHREKANAETLRKRLSELEGQVAKGSSLEPLLADTKARLKSAEAEIEKLRDAIDRLKQQNQADRRAAEDRIRKEQEKTGKALQAARFGMDKERETRELGTQIDGLRSANKDLEDRIKDLEDELKRSFDKDEVFDRLADLQDDMGNNRDQIRGALGPGDELAGALGDLHKRYLDLLGALKKERQDSAADDKAKGNIRDLKALLDEAKQHEAQLEDDNSRREAELKKLGKELQKARSQLAQQGDLGKQLSHEKAAHEQEVASLEHEIAVLKDQLKLAKHAMDQALADARGPLEDRISSLEDKLDALRNKLARSKEQNKQLKAMHGDNAAEQKRLQAQVADLVDALEDAKERARRAADKRAGDKRALEGQIKDLEGELARAQDRLDKTLDNAETQLDRERSASAARIRGLEDELDRMAEKLQKANERAYQQAANGDLARQLGNEVAALQDEVHRARLLSHKLGKADQDNAALEALLDEKNRQLQNLANRDGAQQARVSGLQDQIDELRRMFSGAQGQAMKEKVEKELEAVRAEEKRVHAQATAARDLASAQKQVAELQALLAAKDKELQGHVNKGLADEASIAPLRNEIGNLASALAAQNKELEQLKASLANGGIPLSGYADGSLAAEVEALRAALQARESQVNALLHAGTPLSPPLGHVSITGSPLLNTRVVTTPVVSPGFMESTLGTTPGEIHHHHHFKNTGRRSKSSPEIPVSPTVLGTTASAPVSPVHHHHYDGLPGERSRRKKKARKSVDDSYCNVSEHGDLEYEVGRLEGVLSATQRANTSQNQRESLRLDLQSLENEVEGAVRSRTSSRRSQVHSLDGTLAKLQDHLLTILDHKSNLS
ncbi:centriolin isoform X2 [Nematostella vectensis]|uniref:centriolin isoform X2 n=1 Tax=Nematostella vectensis TaxID=45351 RepID=UPI00207700BF|nr:centriolin isoform X2 [Nematostella vectensis]XP_048586914.1 centriolin isoform X2 [Nematostella vectensis]XP_048586915.1 centriolin isoform X2 [Nematostella vectensis]